jgi:hypothetical protein
MCLSIYGGHMYRGRGHIYRGTGHISRGTGHISRGTGHIRHRTGAYNDMKTQEILSEISGSDGKGRH